MVSFIAQGRGLISLLEALPLWEDSLACWEQPWLCSYGICVIINPGAALDAGRAMSVAGSGALDRPNRVVHTFGIVNA